MTEAVMDPAVLNTLLPAAMILRPDGSLSHAGPTLRKIRPGVEHAKLEGLLRFVHPPIEPNLTDLLPFAKRLLRVELLPKAGSRSAKPTPMRCVAVPLPDGSFVLNLAFGADPTQSLRQHGLTAQDFADTDATVDLLFLLEVHTLLLEAFEQLGTRLEDALNIAEEQAVTDKLTGLRNRRAMDLHLDQLSRKRRPKFGLMHLDLDYFKTVNDTLGHAAGDRVLEEVARILREEVRRGDMVARVGGDEFMLVFEDCVDVEVLKRIASRIIDRLQEPIEWQGQLCRISGSIGITMSSFYKTLTPEVLIADADEALYASKRAGRSRHAVAYPPEAVKGKASARAKKKTPDGAGLKPTAARAGTDGTPAAT